MRQLPSWQASLSDTFATGSGESGKSTIVKQMKIIHQNGYTRDELLVFRLVVYENLIESAQAIVKQMRKMGIDPEVPENRVRTLQVTLRVC